jgi:hypothetical protein
LEREKLCRFLFAYWCFYSAGAAAYMADGDLGPDDYWGRMLRAAYNTVETPVGGRWPRGHERRHFRGPNAVTAVDWYMNKWGDPVRILNYFVTGSAMDGDWDRITHLPFPRVAKRVKEIKQFGPWMAFKVGDMLERVCGVPVAFDNADVFMFDSPMEAAQLVAGQHGRSELPKGQQAQFAVNYLNAQFSDLAAPPKYDRPIRLQETETVLCKWKSSLSGHYPMGLDSGELREGLTVWRQVSPTAGRLLQAFIDFQAGDHNRELGEPVRKGTYQDADDHDMETR